MAQPRQVQPESGPREYGGFTIEQLEAFVRRIPGELGPSHPAQASTAAASATNILMANEVLRILRGGRPPEGDPRRRLYDWAVAETAWDARNAVTGWGSRNAAIQSITAFEAGLITRLSTQDAGTLESGVRSRLLPVLQDISTDLYSNTDYAGFQSCNNAVVMLIPLMGGTIPVPAAAAAAPGLAGAPTTTPQAIPGSAQPLPPLRMRLQDLGIMRPLGVRSDAVVGRYGGQLTDQAAAIFGCQLGRPCSAGDGFVNAYADAKSYDYQHNGDFTGTGGRQIETQLLAALNAIPAGSAIRLDPNFDAALRALRDHNVPGALRALESLSEFNSVLGPVLSNMAFITVNPEAIVIMHAGVFYRHMIGDQNRDSMTSWIQRAQSDPNWQARLLWLGAGLYYQMLNVSGQFTGLGQVRNWSEIGHAIGFNVEAGFGAIVRRTPLEIVVHGSLDFTNWRHNEQIPMAGGESRTLSVGQNWDVSAPFFGIEVRMPAGVTGERARVDLTRIGVGGTVARFSELDQTVGGIIGYVGLVGNWYEGDQFAVRTYVTPEVRWILDQVRVGGRIDPAELTWNWRNTMLSYVPVGTAFQVETGEGRSRVELYTGIQVQSDRGVGGSVRGGPVYDNLGGQGRWGGGVMGLLTLDERIFRSAPAERSATPSATPVRLDITITGQPRSRYLAAVRFLTASPNDATTEAGQTLARELAGFLRGFAIAPVDDARMRLSTTPAFQRALEHLGAGRLREGIGVLRTIPAFRALEQ